MGKEQNRKKKKTVGKIFLAVSAVFLVISVGLFAFVVAARIKGEIPSVFGYTFHIVITDSMTPEINPGDLVVARISDITEAKVGDDVVFVSPNPDLNGIVIVHRVVAVNADGSIMTQGVKAGAPVDPYPVYQIKGKAVAVSAFGGKILSGMSSNRNIVFGAALAILVVIIAEEMIRISLEIYKNKLAKKKEKQGEDQKLSE